jgi:hypothetical protein
MPRRRMPKMRSGDGIKYDLRLPKGYCALWRINRNEKPHYDLQDRMQAQVNAVLMIAVRAGTKAREIAVVSSWVAIKDRILMINAYTDYKDATTFDTLLAHTKDALMTTLKATRQPLAANEDRGTAGRQARRWLSMSPSMPRQLYAESLVQFGIDVFGRK